MHGHLIIITLGSYSALSQVSPLQVHFIIKLKQPTSKHTLETHKSVIKHSPLPPIYTHAYIRTHMHANTWACFAVFPTVDILLQFSKCTDRDFLSY